MDKYKGLAQIVLAKWNSTLIYFEPGGGWGVDDSVNNRPNMFVEIFQKYS